MVEKQFMPFLKSLHLFRAECWRYKLCRELLEGSHTSVTSSDGIVIVDIQNIHPLALESTTQQELSSPATARHLHVHFADERNCEQPGKPRSEI